MNGWPPESAEEAEHFVDAALHHGLIELLAEEAAMPEAVHAAVRRFAALRQAYRLRTQIVLRTLQRLMDILESEPVILLKGCDYIFRLYSAPHLRQMADIDFLVPRTRYEAVIERLRRAGLQQNFPAGAASRLASHHESVFHMERVTIEPHHSFIQRPRHAVDYDAIWERRVPMRGGDVAAFRLSDEDAILYAALSLAIKQFNVPLIRYLDLYLLFEKYEGALDPLVGRAHQWRIERAFFCALHQTRLIFPEMAPRLEPAESRLLTAEEREFLRRRVLPKETLGQNTRAQQLWRKFHLMDGYGERLSFLAYHVYATLAGNLRRQ